MPAMPTFIDRFSALAVLLSRILAVLAAVFLAAMLVLACANMLLRPFDMPLEGTYEFMGFFGAAATAFALGLSQVHKAHIAVGLLAKLFPAGLRRVLDAAGLAASTAFFGLMGWQVADKGMFLLATGEVSETLHVVYYPFVFAAALGCWMMTLVLLANLLSMFQPERSGA